MRGEWKARVKVKQNFGYFMQEGAERQQQQQQFCTAIDAYRPEGNWLLTNDDDNDY